LRVSACVKLKLAISKLTGAIFDVMVVVVLVEKVRNVAMQ
jgi:hypothetical protein